MNELRLGIIGLSEGNGHPYSWSAIFNGFDPQEMSRCPFPAIPEYLARQKFPEDAIADARVTHIWTQDKAISERISRASLVRNIVDKYADMIGQVDAILLARDDAENHYEMSAPFIDAGLPIYIDKPLATRVEDAERIYALERYPGQIFTCSALAYAREFEFGGSVQEKLGRLSKIEAFANKDWAKYGVHIIEPVLNIIGHQGRLSSIKAVRSERGRKVEVTWESGLKTSFSTSGREKSPIELVIIGEKRSKKLIFKDTFAAFKTALETFVRIVRKQEAVQSKERVLKIIDIIEAGVLYE